LRPVGYRRLEAPAQRTDIDTCLLEQGGRDALGLIQESQQEVFVIELDVIFVRRSGLRILQGFLHALGKAIQIHWEV
jgi:hypothetical protein